MKVGTDGVLLGAWSNVSATGGQDVKPKRILDVGTGTGLIALMAAQRNPNAHITAIDIDPDAVRQAKENVCASPFAERITVRIHRLHLDGDRLLRGRGRPGLHIERGQRGGQASVVAARVLAGRECDGDVDSF